MSISSEKEGVIRKLKVMIGSEKHELVMAWAKQPERKVFHITKWRQKEKLEHLMIEANKERRKDTKSDTTNVINLSKTKQLGEGELQVPPRGFHLSPPPPPGSLQSKNSLPALRMQPEN